MNKLTILSLILMSLVMVCWSKSVHEETRLSFERFKKTFNKSYSSSAEEAKRIQIFAKNIEKINEFNRANKSARLGINKFTDLEHREVVIQRTGLRSGKNMTRPQRLNSNKPLALTSSVPDSFGKIFKHIYYFSPFPSSLNY
jgi:hypothetical protein